jgi:endonuclease III
LPQSRKTIQSRMLRVIAKRFPVKVWKAGGAFETLVQTILSQNTNDRNSEAAMNRLRKHYKINPQTLARARVSELIPYIRQAGLYRSKAPRIIETSRIIEERYGGRLAHVLDQPYLQAKEELMTLPGVGPKTADILLAFVARNPVIPVDTHIARVTKRLGIARSKANYEEVRTSLEALIAPQNRVRVHLSIIDFGRKICRAPRPRCAICPVNKSCPSSTI